MARCNIHRFDSITSMLSFCRDLYGTPEVSKESRGLDMVLRVRFPDGEGFKSLIVHFKGARTYAVHLPAPQGWRGTGRMRLTG